MNNLKVWMNKKSGDLVIAKEYWDTIAEIPSMGLNLLKEMASSDPLIKETVDSGNNFLDHTKQMLVYQAGWLVSNNHGLYFVLNMSAKDEFEEIGEF